MKAIQICVVTAILTLGEVAAWGQSIWRGLAVSPEMRCAPYDAAAYQYSQGLERAAIAAMGGRVYGPYTGTTFSRPTETDIEHIVARSEAHDSGLCGRNAAVKRQFANDLLNITLAAPAVNRVAKNDRDAAEWMPPQNRCWFADRVIEVRRKYNLTIDRSEAASLDRVLSGCRSTDMLFFSGPAPVAEPRSAGGLALDRWDTNGNGRISCAEARAHGIAPVRREHPAYAFMLDGDGDGVVCE